MTRESQSRRVVELLRESRDICVRIGAVKTAKRIRFALRSADGAVRNAHLKDFRDSERGIQS